MGSEDTNARLWDLFTETPSHVLSGHKGWVSCVEWEARELKLVTGGHDGHVRSIFTRTSFNHLEAKPSLCPHMLLSDQIQRFLGTSMGPKTGKATGDALKGHTKWVTSLAWEPIHMSVPFPLFVAFVFNLM
jgi:ribosome assembly protein 4